MLVVPTGNPSQDAVKDRGYQPEELFTHFRHVGDLHEREDFFNIQRRVFPFPEVSPVVSAEELTESRELVKAEPPLVD